MKPQQEQRRKQNNLVTLIKYNLRPSFQENQDRELNMLNGYIDAHNMCIFTLIQFVSFQVRPNENHKMNINTKKN